MTEHRTDAIDVDLVGKLLSLAVVLLPVAGVLSRLAGLLFRGDLSLSLNQFLGLALAAPIANLVAGGALSVLFVLGLLISARGLILLAPMLQQWDQGSEALHGHNEARGALKRRLQDMRSRSSGFFEHVENRGVDQETLVRAGELDAELSDLERDVDEEVARWDKEKASLIERVSELDERAKSAATTGPIAALIDFVVRRRMAAVLLLAATLVGLMLVPEGVALLILLLGSVSPLAYLVRLGRTRGKLTFGETWPVVLWIILFGTIWSGLMGAIPGSGSAFYEFADSVVEEGWYGEIGREGEMHYLLPCADRPRVISIRSSQIEVVRLGVKPGRRNPSLFRMLMGQEKSRLGIQFRCPLTR